MAQIRFKRGDTFTLSCVYKVDNVPSDVTNVQIKSQVRNRRYELIQELTVVKSGDVGEFSLSASSADTTIWPVKILYCDVQFTVDGIVRSSQTFEINVIEEITK